MNFSIRFRELLEGCGRTQKDVAAALGLSEGALINYKRDSIPKSMELLAIARFFGVTMEWLLTGESGGKTQVQTMRMGPDLSEARAAVREAKAVLAKLEKVLG